MVVGPAGVKIAKEGCTSGATPVPTSITRRDEGLLFQWTPEGAAAWLSARALRLACPCAQCVDEMSGRPLLDPVAVAADIRPVHLALVGTYGLRIHWSDGHATGIYTFEFLRRQPQTGAPTQ